MNLHLIYTVQVKITTIFGFLEKKSFVFWTKVGSFAVIRQNDIIGSEFLLINNVFETVKITESFKLLDENF